MEDERQKLRHEVEHQVERMKQAEKDRSTVLAQSVYLGTLGLLFVLPIVAGAYLGQWLDETLIESSINWTLNLMFLGIAIGVVNVWLLIRRN
jgi:ATP synthase protein I